MMRLLYGLLMVTALLAGCAGTSDDSPAPKPTAMRRLVLINEGNFLAGNASVTFYYPDSQRVEQDVFRRVNGRPLGDVAQSYLEHEGLGYLVVNNSHRIEVVDAATFRSVGMIEGLNSPRYMCLSGNGRAYVTDLYENAIHVVDLAARKVVKSIPCRGWTEEMLRVGDSVYVTNVRTRYVYIIDIASDAVVDSIEVGWGPNGIVQNARGEVWIVCNGGVKEDGRFIEDVGGLYRFLPGERKAVMAAVCKTGAKCVRVAGNRVYVLDGDIRYVEVGGPLTTLVAAGNRNFYSLAVDGSQVYAADAKDFLQRGDVWRFDSTGREVHRFATGVIPGYLYVTP